MGKKALCLIFAFLLSINSFAAIVSDNDGAAFITKAEFEAMKDNFNQQIDNYNNSIDSKIDGAIAAYLAGFQIEKTSTLNPLVTNYKDIKWKNDLYGKVTIRDFSNYNTYTDQTLGWHKLAFPNYRVLRAGRYYLGAVKFQDVAEYDLVFNINGNVAYVTFPADDGWFPSGEGQGGTFDQPRSNGVLVIMCKESNDGVEINTDDGIRVEGQMRDVAYPAIISNNEYLWASTAISGGHADAGCFEVAKEADDLIAFNVRFYQWTDMTGTAESGPYNKGPIRIKKSKSGYGQSNFADPRVGLPTMLWPNNNLGNFGKHFIVNCWETVNQRERDRESFKVLFLGNDTATEVNCAVELKEKSFSAWTSYDFSESELGSFEGSASINTSQAARGTGQSLSFKNSSNVEVNARLSLPLWPKYELKDLINPDFKVNNKGLKIGGGIPIVQKIVDKGTIKVKLSYEVGNDDLSVSTTPSQDVYLSFKKSDFNDSSDEYYEDDAGKKLKDILLEPTSSDTTYEVSIPVKADENMWFRIGPKERNESGLYAKINNLDVKLLTE